MVGTTTERAIFEVPAWLPADTEESVVGTQWHQEATGALATMLVEVGRRHGAGWGIARGIALLDTGCPLPGWETLRSETRRCHEPPRLRGGLFGRPSKPVVTRPSQGAIRFYRATCRRS